jgi:hypothetical protein
MKMKKLSIRLFFLFGFIAIGYSVSGQMDTLAMFGVTPQQEEAAKKWLDNLYEMGVKIDGDSIFISEEARRVATDSLYRTVIFREQYTWEVANYLFAINQYKIAFWHLINIYTDDPARREDVLKYILTFDNALQMDKALIGSFYTYAFLDPEVATIVNGRPDVRHPEIIEEKLARVREMVRYIVAYREQQK